MKLSEAMDIINSQPGFMVKIHWRVAGNMYGGQFPDKQEGEDLISTEAEAWELAKKFSDKTKGKYWDVYVIGNDFKPVDQSSDRRVFNKYA